MNTDTPTIEHEAGSESNKIINVRWASIGLYLLFAFGLTWAIFIGLRALGVPLVVYAAAGMFGPALAALLTRLIRREDFADAGLRLVERGRGGGGWMYLAAYIAPPLVIAASIGFVLFTGYQHWTFSIQGYGQTLVDTLHQSGQAVPQGMTPEQLGQITLLTNLMMALTLGPITNSIFTFGEEFGWRGYLLPRLVPLGGVTAAIVVGIIWGLWHAPLIILDGYNYPGHPWLGVLMMVVFCTALSIIMAWLRFRSGSIWPPVLAHAVINAQAGFSLIVLSKGDSLVGAPMGLLGLVPLIVLAIVLVVTRQLKPDVPAKRRPEKMVRHAA